MSSLGLVTRSVVPVLGALLFTSVLILLKRSTTGTVKDKFNLHFILSGDPLNPSRDIVSREFCYSFGGAALALGLLHFHYLGEVYYERFTVEGVMNRDVWTACFVSFFQGFIVVALAVSTCFSAINVYLLVLLLCLYAIILDVLKFLDEVSTRLRNIVTNYNGYRMSSLGLITRSSIPALTSVLAGSVLILLNRWMNGNWEDKWEILPIINVFYLNAPHPLPAPGAVLLLLVVSAIGAVCSVWFELMRFEVSLMTVHMGWGFIHGFKWFLFSEGALFFGFFWTYFHFAWSVDYKTGGFPNYHIVTVDPFCVPLTNTVVLISSGFTLTYANHALIVGCHEECLQAMTYTVMLGVFFSYQQWWEYNCCRFTICQGSFASIFYMATGFHGAHVQIGTAFVLYNMYRVSEGEFHRGRWVGWRMGLWYWHFVDIIWIALYLTIYVWN